MKTFENFVTGRGNRMAQIAAERICEKPGEYNPLYIWGASGTGKTHLLQALTHVFQQQGKTALYFSCQQFTEEMIDAIKNGTLTEFRKKYCDADIILMDGFSYLKGKDSTQAILCEVLWQRLSENKQVVLAESLSPAEISQWNSELYAFLSLGLSLKIQQPDYEETAQVIARKLQDHGMNWPASACQYAALNITTQRGHIDGEVKKIVFLNSLMNEEK